MIGKGWKRILTAAAAVVLLGSSCESRTIRSVGAAGGRADLTRGFDFAGGELARLDGEWEYFPDELLTPGELGVRGPSAAAARVPSAWTEASGFNLRGLDPKGSGTLRLTLALPPSEGPWALRLPNASSATRLYANGKPAAEIGVVSGNRDTYVPSNGIAFPEFPAEDGRLELVMQVANFAAPYIGTWDSPLLGSAEAILGKRQADLTTTSLISGALLIMGLYHLGLFVLRKKDRTSLYFGIICLFMTTRNLMMGERLLLELFPPTAAGWAWAFRIEHLSAHFTVPLFGLFFGELFPRQVRRLPVKIILSVGLLWACMILALPPAIYQLFLHWYEVFLLFAGLFVLVALIVAAVKREDGAALVCFGLFGLMATAANDVFLSIGLISNTVYMSSYGVFFYIFTQSFHLSMVFARAFKDVEDLSFNLTQKNRELESLHTIDQAITSSMELDRVLSIILEQAADKLDMDAADVLLFDSESDTLSLGARLGFRTDALIHTSLKAGQGFAGRALQKDEAVIVEDLERNAQGFSRSPAFAAEDFRFYAGRSLAVKGKIVGVLELYRRSSFRVNDNWNLFFTNLAGQAAVALDNSALLRGLMQANRELAEANEATIESWAEALELRDQETEGHSRRVTEATVALAREFGIGGAELDCVRHGALLHDIGKMGIPDSILLKPGPLDDEEFAVMKRHPAIARDLLSRLRFMERSLEIPYGHHEKWDGTGYPRGLAGTDIPLSARLFAVVDVWDALRSDRPYRRAWDEERVLDHLAGLSGTHFYPQAVDAFVRMRRGIGA